MTTVAFILVSWRPDAPAGMERSVASAALGLAAIGHWALIITAEPNAPADYNGIPVLKLRTLTVPTPSDDDTLRRAIDQAAHALHAELLDIYNAHRVDAAIYVDGLWGLGRCMPTEGSTKRVLAIHVVGHDVDLTSALDRAQVVIAPSSVVASHAAELGYDTRTWRVVPNALLTVPQPPSPERRRWLREHGPIRVLARLGPEKGVRELLDAAVRLRPSRRAQAALAEAGFEATSGSQHQLWLACQRLAEQSGISMQPGLPWPDVAGWLAGASVVIVPSHAETFGLVALEALAAGTPIVCFDVGNLPDLVGAAGIAVPRNHGHIALWRGAETLLADALAYERTSRAGYYQTRDYRPAHIADLLLKVVS